MEESKELRDRFVGLKLTQSEYRQIEKRWKASTCRKLSDYLRKVVFQKPVTTYYRNRSLDELIEVLIPLRKDLNGIANNFNQAVHKLHTLDHIPQFKRWIITYEGEKHSLLKQVEALKEHMDKIADQWLQ